MALAEAAYALTRGFPREEAYGVTSQVRRAAVSIAANIAEGHGRDSTGAFVQSLRVSQGSLKELETHIILATRVGLAAEKETNTMLEECEQLGKMLRSLIRSLQRKASGG